MNSLQYIGPLVILLLTTELQAGILRDIHNKNKEHLVAILDPLGIFHNNGAGNGGSVNAQAESSSINQNFNLGPIKFSTSLNHASASANANSESGSATAHADVITNGGNYENGYSKAVANANVIANANTNANNRQYNGVHHSEYNSVQNGRYNVGNNDGVYNTENMGEWNSRHVEYSNGGDGDGDEKYSNNGVSSASSSSSSSVGIGGKTHTITNTKTHGDARANAEAVAMGHGLYGGKAHNNLKFDHQIMKPYGMNSGFYSGEKSESFVDNNQHYRDNPFLTNVGGNAKANVNAQTELYYGNNGKIRNYVNGQSQQLNQGELFLGRGEREPYYEKGYNVDVHLNDAMNIYTNINAASNIGIDDDVHSENNNNGNKYGEFYGSRSYGAINVGNIETPLLDEPNKQMYNAANSGGFVIDDGYRELTNANASATSISGHSQAIANAKVSSGGDVVASATANANINIDPEFSSKSSTLTKTSVIADTSKMLIFSE